MEILITINEKGKLETTIKGMSVLNAVGAMEVAKKMLLNGELAQTTIPQSEVIEG